MLKPFAIWPRAVRLAGSPLTRLLAAGFLCLALLNAGLIWYLCERVTSVEQTAAHEYKTLKAINDLSELAVYLRSRLSELVPAAMANDRDPNYIASANNVSEALDSRYRVLQQEWYDAKLEPNTLRCTKGYIDAIITMKRIMAGTESKGTRLNAAYQLFLSACDRLYQAGRDAVATVSERMNLDTAKEHIEDLQPLMLIATGLGLAISFSILYVVETTIARPISRLARQCAQLAAGGHLPRPDVVRNEIESLQLTFHQMSLAVAHNERARKTYVELLNQAQTETLHNVSAKVEAFVKACPQIGKSSRLDLLARNIDGMLQLLKSLTEGLNYSEADLLTLKESMVSTTTLFQTAAAAVDALASKAEVRIEITEPGCDILVDEHLIERVLINLLSNAIKFSPENSVVQLRGRVDANQFHVEILDSGPGISKNDQKKLFQKFSRVRSADKIVRPGSGLGLLICKQIVEAHGGQIGCESDVGKGTKFKFSIPINLSTKSSAVAPRLYKKPDQTKYGSIKTGFVTMMVLFILCQAVVTTQLQSQLNEAGRTGASYTMQKNLVIQTQDLTMRFLSWRQRMLVAFNFNRISSITPLYPELRSIQKFAQNLAVQTRGLPIHERFAVTAEVTQRATRVFENLFDAGPQMPMLALIGKARAAEVYGAQVEDQLFAALTLSGKEFKASYDLSKVVREHIAIVLIVTALADALILLSLLVICSRILQKIELLNLKAAQFAEGQHLEYSIPGSDEFSYLDRQLCDRSELIYQAEQQRQNLLATINHDLRTPIGSALARMEMVSLGTFGVLDEEELAPISSSEKLLMKLLEQINDLLIIEKLEAGFSDGANSLIDLRQCLELAVDQAQEAFPGKAVDVQVADGSPANKFLVHADQALLTRLCRALIDNALAASPVLEPVVVRLQSDNGNPSIRVEDHGAGIPATLQKQLFDRFRFVDGKPITGFGLPLSQRICKQLGATLNVEATSESGTTMQVLFHPAC